ncbi:Uncharacterised protein [uncultured archaeon]|nr:Uncharacterised protein [uncultured archaeon]
MPTIEHFDIPATDVVRAKAFYEGLFGWSITKTPIPGVEYWVIQTADLQGRRGLRGGMMRRQGEEQSPLNYVAVEDIEASVRKCAELGGKVRHRSEQAGVGKFAIVEDTEGNRIGLWQRAPSAKP